MAQMMIEHATALNCKKTIIVNEQDVMKKIKFGCQQI